MSIILEGSVVCSTTVDTAPSLSAAALRMVCVWVYVWGCEGVCVGGGGGELLYYQQQALIIDLPSPLGMPIINLPSPLGTTIIDLPSLLGIPIFPLPHLLPAGSLPCVSGWRLLDGAPYWAPRLGQELRKVKQPLPISLKIIRCDVLRRCGYT